MAGESLVVRKLAAESAKAALFSARNLKEALDVKYDAKRKAATLAQSKAELLTVKLNLKRSNHADLLKELTRARALLQKLNDEKEQAEKAYKDAVEQSGPDDVLRELGLAVQQAQSRYQEQEQLVSELETDVGMSDDRLEVATLEHRDAVVKQERAEAALDNITMERDRARQDLADSEREADVTSQSVLDISITSETLVTEWANVSNLSVTRRTPGFLKIRVPRKEIDRDIDILLKDMAAKSVGNTHKEKALRKTIASTGTAAEVGKAAEMIGKRRWQDIGLRVIAATWYDSLLSIAGVEIDPATGNILASRPAKDIQVEFQDTAGLVESILIHQQDPDKGPLKHFATQYVERVIEKRRLNLTKFQCDLIADQLHATLLY